MPDLPISQLPPLLTPEPSDEFAIVNSGITKKTTVQAVANSVFNEISSSVILPSQTSSLGVQSFYGSFYHTASLLNAIASAENTMSFSTTDFAYGVSISGSYRDKIKIEYSGIYNIQFSVQLDKSTSTNTTVYIWLSKNGTNVPDSNTGVTLGGGQNDSSVAAWNFFVSASSGDYYQLKWGADRTNARILYATSSIGPTVPSVILTVNRIA